MLLFQERKFKFYSEFLCLHIERVTERNQKFSTCSNWASQ